MTAFCKNLDTGSQHSLILQYEETTKISAQLPDHWLGFYKTIGFPNPGCGGGGGVLGFSFAGYVPLASQSAPAPL